MVPIFAFFYRVKFICFKLYNPFLFCGAFTLQQSVKVEMGRGTLGGSKEGWEGLGKSARSWGRLGGTWEGLEGLEKAEDV